jgi:lysophospholipase L1-like esterase
MFVTPSIPVRSQARVPAIDGDGGTFPLLMVRNFINTGNANAAYSRPASPTFGTSYTAANNAGMTLAAKANVGGGNFVTSNIAGFSAGTADVNPFFTTMGVIFQYDQLVTTVCGIGDSIMAGSGDGASQCTPFIWQACMNLRAQGKSLAYYNCGVPSGGIADFAYNGNNVITNIKPDVIVLPAYTINSAHVTQADYDTQWYTIMGIAAQATAAGIKVIMQTCYPHNGDSAGEFAIKLNQDQRVRNSGFPFIDFSSMYGVNGAFLNQAWCVGDNVHPSPLGNQVMAAISQPTIAANLIA